jgi:2-keto-4-pentenoate hydratase/2-oxohepta-3-ene-1,7-dioic acid hydratase in catechol pathway
MECECAQLSPEGDESMRWVTFRRGPHDGDRVGVVVDAQVHVLPDDVTLLGLLGAGLAGAGERALRDPVEVVSLAEVTLRAPIPQPPTVRDFYAFEQHVKTARKRRGLEMDPDWYELPVFYFSNPYAVNGDGEPVAVPPGSSEFDFELEVAAVIGRGGSDLTPQQGEDSIAGFCVMNDWSARDIQRREIP